MFYDSDTLSGVAAGKEIKLPNRFNRCVIALLFTGTATASISVQIGEGIEYFPLEFTGIDETVSPVTILVESPFEKVRLNVDNHTSGDVIMQVRAW